MTANIIKLQTVEINVLWFSRGGNKFYPKRTKFFEISIAL